MTDAGKTTRKTKARHAALTMGPVLFHWEPEKWRDFYFRIADEAPVDRVYIGEAICSKRAPFYAPMYAEVCARLEKGGKEIFFSTLSEVTVKPDRRLVESVCASAAEYGVEANDASALLHLSGRRHAIGPLMNVYNEDAMLFLSGKGAFHFSLPAELPSSGIGVLAKTAQKIGVTTEVQVYGRLPLALSARCYHARAHGRTKDNCQFACGADCDGLVLETLDKRPFLVVNGIQTMSYACLNLAGELAEMRDMGINAFRLSPHAHDMVAVARIFRDVLDGQLPAASAHGKLRRMTDMPFSNGFYHGKEGFLWTGQENSAPHSSVARRAR